MDSNGKGNGGLNVESKRVDKSCANSDSEKVFPELDASFWEEQYFELHRWRGISLDLINKIGEEGIACGFEEGANDQGNDGNGEIELSDDIVVLEEEGCGGDEGIIEVDTEAGNGVNGKIYKVDYGVNGDTETGNGESDVEDVAEEESDDTDCDSEDVVDDGSDYEEGRIWIPINWVWEIVIGL